MNFKAVATSLVGMFLLAPSVVIAGPGATSPTPQLEARVFKPVVIEELAKKAWAKKSPYALLQEGSTKLTVGPTPPGGTVKTRPFNKTWFW